MKDLREFRLSHDRFITPPQEVLTRWNPTTTTMLIWVSLNTYLLVKARDSGKIKMSRMGFVNFRPKSL